MGYLPRLKEEYKSRIVAASKEEFGYKNVMQVAPNEKAKQKVKVILNELHPDKNLEVPDPYYGGQKGFENVYTMLDNACEIIANRLLKFE